MKKSSIAVVLGLLAVPFSGAAGQSTNLASLPDTQGEYVVFFDSSSRELSPAAIATVERAADAARTAPVISLEGRADHANAVKAELVRQGAPSDRIRIRPPSTGLQKVGVTDPIERRVEISF